MVFFQVVYHDSQFAIFNTLKTLLIKIVEEWSPDGDPDAGASGGRWMYHGHDHGQRLFVWRHRAGHILHWGMLWFYLVLFKSIDFVAGMLVRGKGMDLTFIASFFLCTETPNRSPSEVGSRWTFVFFVKRGGDRNIAILYTRILPLLVDIFSSFAGL